MCMGHVRTAKEGALVLIRLDGSCGPRRLLRHWETQPMSHLFTASTQTNTYDTHWAAAPVAERASIYTLTNKQPFAYHSPNSTRPHLPPAEEVIRTAVVSVAFDLKRTGKHFKLISWNEADDITANQGVPLHPWAPLHSNVISC
uniref:Uncharacterized protein n=1 Tax=Knipowitschia caucasica TaxID=637954 RepID=A0AAV2MAN9_KNICA